MVDRSKCTPKKKKAELLSPNGLAAPSAEDTHYALNRRHRQFENELRTRNIPHSTHPNGRVDYAPYSDSTTRETQTHSHDTVP